jgi:hypothetical protein
MIDSFLVFGDRADTSASPEPANAGMALSGAAVEAVVHLPLAGLVLRVALPLSAAPAARRKVNA